jgi:transcriptional regulator with XRE-family HTH domain
MNEDFSRTLALLRQEAGLSQRQAAKDLGISQALLSHYENGVREPGLAFVRRACDYYRVSADYLLGRTLDRDGAVISADELYDASVEKGSLKGSIVAMLHKKLLVNTTSLLFELLGRTGSREAVNAAARYLGGALYQLYRMLYRAAGGKDKFFSLGGTAFSMDAVDAEMRLARVSFAQSLDALEDDGAALPAMDGAALGAAYPGLSQSLTQVLHGTEEETNKLLGR